jgi:UDP-N-acetyl-D-glucosamine dehydrogenase
MLLDPEIRGIRSARSRMNSIAIIGLGYVGLPLAIQFVRSCYDVLGLDIDPAKVELLNAGKSYIKHISENSIGEMITAGKLKTSTDFRGVRDVDAIIICVPTPLTKNREPDLSYVLNTGRAIAPHIQPGTLVVLESSTYPGTTDGELREVLEEGSGMKAGQDFHLAYSPEREDPGNSKCRLGQIPKVVGALTPVCLEKAKALYSRVVETVVPVSSCAAAEATKLAENIFRSVNIALVNELKVIYTAMGIDVWEVIEAAKTKPFGFMPFYPGPGLGGHCIPIDPFYLTWKARQYGKHTRFIELAGEINHAMPDYVVQRSMEALNHRGKAVKGSRVLILGLAYKPDVDDPRESPTFVLLERFRDLGATIDYLDPLLPVIGPTREYSHWAGKTSVKWDETTIRSYDLVVIATCHRSFNLTQLAEWAKLIVDTRNSMAALNTNGNGRIVKA